LWWWGASRGVAQGQNLVTNGDFENNSAGSTQYNRTNAQFTGFMATSTAFGGSEELDIVTGSALGIPPQSGNWKVGLHQRTNDPANVDAFSLLLSSATVNGGSCTVSFYATGVPGAALGTTEIGLSNNPSDFGTLIASGTPSNSTAWHLFSANIVSPGSFSYITVRNSLLPTGNYAFIDNLSLEVPAPGAVALLGLLAGPRRRSRR
jgi:hypothetical protein